MRREAKPGFRLQAILLLPCLLLGAATAASDELPGDGLALYFRDADLGALSDQDLATYPEVDAGESKLLGRDFPDAPPQVPHTVVDMLPITSDDNECLNCHHPENAVSEADSPLPETHFQRAVMARGKPGDSMAWVVERYVKAKDVVGSRYNCSMCHTPQASNVRTPRNGFVRVEVK